METIVRQVRQQLSLPIDLYGDPFIAECSIGVAYAHKGEISSLLSSSDIALYEAKNAGRNRDEVFTPALAERLNQKKRLLHELQIGMKAGEIVPFYQVQVSARDQTVCGLEALARWESSGGLRMPADFLPLAAAHGLMDRIDELILQRVLLDISRWRMAGLDVPRVSVNLSAARLADPQLPEKLRAIAIPPGQLSFEFIETIFFDRLSDQVKNNITQIRELGIEIEIDDLGSGHASLLALVELRPDRVKIDRHLVSPVLGNTTQQRLISALIDIARTLNMGVVAEGVETSEHAKLLVELGADILQGYAFGRPQSASAVARRLSQQRSQEIRERA
jgi:EAL domain-containing protein (putative c-di-GMP-specific phosphodiesterase class I)